jgi:hypothetical protein
LSVELRQLLTSKQALIDQKAESDARVKHLETDKETLNISVSSTAVCAARAPVVALELIGCIHI